MIILREWSGSGGMKGCSFGIAYLRSLLRNERDPQSEVAPDLAPPVIVPATPSPALGTLVSDLAGERIRAMRKEIEALDPAERQVWVDRALQSLASKGMLTAIVSRRASQGDVMHGLLGSMVVQTYAAATYGPDWNVQVGPNPLA